MIGRIALALVTVTVLVGCGGGQSPYDEGYDQGYSVSNVSEDEIPPATGDRCLDLSAAWYLAELEDGTPPPNDGQDEFRRGCRAGIAEGAS
jgi:hypothetical protein